MFKFIQRKILQYIICKHTNYTVLKKIMCVDNNQTKTKYMEKCKCNVCDRTFYSNYFYEYGNDRHFESERL